MTNKARTLLGKGRRRIGRTFSTDEERGVTAEHWGEDAREKAESEDWQGLYWQSYILTARHINRDISGDPDVDWLDVHEAPLLPEARRARAQPRLWVRDRRARSGSSTRSRDRFEALRHLARGGRRRREEAEKAGLGDRIDYAAADLNTIELEPGRYDAVFAVQTLHHIEALEHLLDQIHGSLTTGRALRRQRVRRARRASSSRTSTCR